MEKEGLYRLIKHLEFGTKLHIGVVFLGAVNKMCELPHSHTIHENYICNRFKRIPKEYERCLRCRNLAIRRAIRDRKGFGALCINGVYEYTRPIFNAGKILGVIFIGNILTEDGEGKLITKMPSEEIPRETMQKDFDLSSCEEIGQIIEEYILMLLEKYPEQRNNSSPIIDNIINYIKDNYEYDLSISDISSLYFYNEVYLGRLFKESVGKSFKEYVNSIRVKRAQELLHTNRPIIEIAQSVGYNNVTYFNRVFKREIGKTPSEYRKGIERLP